MKHEPNSLPPRSALFVPGDKPRAIEKAPGLGADALILDLEDAVAPANKPAARQGARDAIAHFRSAGALTVIRVGEPGSPELAADLKAVSESAPDAVLVAKVDEAQTLRPIRQALDSAGLTIPIWAMIETPLALTGLDQYRTAASELGISLLMAGVNDLAEGLRLPEHARRAGCEPHLAQLVLQARAANLHVIDGVYNAYQDPEGFKIEAEAGRALGFDGKSLIHPSQVAPANTAFGPSFSEITWARRVVDAFADPANADKGAVALDGRMVEAMHARQAQAVLARAPTQEE